MYSGRKRKYVSSFGGKRAIKKKYKRKYKKRYYGGRRYNYKSRYPRSKRNTKTTVKAPYIQRYLTPRVKAPRIAYCKFHYNATGVISMSTSQYTSSYTVYRANSIWDPQWSIGGQTVFGYHLLDPYYDKYTVLASKITVKFFSSCDHMVRPFIMGSYNSTLPTWGTDKDLLDDNRVKSAFLPMRYAGNVTKLKLYRKTKDMVSEDPWETSLSGNYNESTGSNPTTQWYWLIGAMSLPTTGAATNNRIYWTAKITYYTRLHNYTFVTNEETVPS